MDRVQETIEDALEQEGAEHFEGEPFGTSAGAFGTETPTAAAVLDKEPSAAGHADIIKERVRSI